MSTPNLPFALDGATGNDPAGGDVTPPEDPRELLLAMTLEAFDELVALVAAIDDDARITARPPLPGANSLAGILHHCCAMMRHWSSTVNLGEPVPRDRAHEFDPDLGVAELVDLARTTADAFTSDVARTDLGAAPAADPQDASFWTTTCRGVLLHVHREICQHLGQAEITRDLLTTRDQLSD